LAKNKRLQYLNISGNQLVDGLADAYDMFDLDALNSSKKEKPKKETKKEKGAKGKDKVVDAATTQKKKPKFKLKRRILAKVTQEWVMESLRSFLLANESLISFDLSNTGLDESGIIELVKLLKGTEQRHSEDDV